MKKTGKRLRRAAALLLSLCLSAGLLTTAALALDTPAAPTNLRFEIEPHDPKQEKVSNSPTDTHQWALVWRWDEKDHWRNCLEEGCSEQTDKAAHLMDTDGSCTVCGYDPDYPDLAVPTNLRWDGTVAKWDAVENAGKYRLTLYQNGKLMWAQDVKATERDFGGWLKDPGEFYFTVAPMQAGYTYSYPGPVPHWAAQSPAYINETGSEEEQPYNPTVIERIELDMEAPAAGQPLGRPRTAEDALYQVDGFSWQLCAGPGGSGIEYLFSGEDNFENGKCYRLYIGLQAEFNCVISENATATFGGLSPDRIEIETSEHGDISSIVAWFTVGTPTVPTEISELTFSKIPEPTSGINFTEAQEVAQTHINDSVAGIYQARVSYYKWDGAKDWDGQYSSDAYDENGHYALGLELKAADGYKFGEDITVTVNEKTARIISQSDYSIEVFMLFNPDNPIIINYVEINSKAWPHDKVEIQIEEDNFQINDYIHSYGDMAMFTIKEAELKISEDQGSTWRLLKSTDTHFAQRFRYGFFVTVEAREGAKFDPNMTASINGAASVQVSNDGKTAEIYRDHLRVYKNAGVSSMSGGDTIWDDDSVPIAINKPVAGASTLVQEKYAAAVVTSRSLGLKANGHWYEVPYVGSTYVLKDRPETFESGKTYMLAVDFECETSGEYSFGGPFEVEKFVNYNNIDEIINYARKEALTNDDPHFKQSYRYWFTVDGATSEPEKITEISITGPEVLRDALGDETIYSLSEEQLAQFKVDGDVTVEDIWWSGSGRLYLDLAVPSGHYFEIPSKLSVKYNGSDAQIYTVGFGVYPYDLLSVTIMDVPSAAATVTQGGTVTKYETLESAVAALGEKEGVITLLRSAEVVGTDDSSILSIPVTAKLKINENATLTVPEGKTLQLANPAFLNSPGSIAVEAGGTLNIPDSTGNSTAFVGADDSARIKLTEGQMTFQIGENLLTLAKNAKAEIPEGQEAWLLKSTDGTEKLPLDAVIETGAKLTVNGTLNAISGTDRSGSTLTVKGTLDASGGTLSVAMYAEVAVEQGGKVTLSPASLLSGGILGKATIAAGGSVAVGDDDWIGTGGNVNLTTGRMTLDFGDIASRKIAATLTGNAQATVPTGKRWTLKVGTEDASANVNLTVDAGSTLAVAGEFHVANNSTLTLDGAVDITGHLSIGSAGTVTGIGSITNSGVLTLDKGADGAVGNLSVNVALSGSGKAYAMTDIAEKLTNAEKLEDNIYNNVEYAFAWAAKVPDPTPGGDSGGVSTYAITVEDSENGEVESSRTRAARGDTVTLTVTPDEGYELDTLTVTDSKGKELELTNKGGGKYTFEMPSGKVTVEAEFVQEEAAELPFTDVPENAWYYDAVAYAYENGWMNGTTSTTFAPGSTTSRGMIVTILHRIEGKPSIQESSAFLDVPLDAWYADAVDWAAEHGIVEGYSDTAFGPNDPITREQMAAILYRYAQYKGYDVSAKADLNKFTDADEISNYALEALQWANAEGLINGKGDGVLDPKGQATRAEAAVILTRFNEVVAE